MKLADRVLEELSDDLHKPARKKPVNFSLKVMINFADGALNPRGSAVKVKALDAEDAKKVARARIEQNWKNVKSIEFLSVKKG
jgi:hypothetical protein